MIKNQYLYLQLTVAIISKKADEKGGKRHGRISRRPDGRVELQYGIYDPSFGGIDVLESVVVTWIIMAVLMAASLLLVRSLKLRKIGNRQAALESGISFIYDFFEELLGEEGKDYIPYLITVVLYIGIANMIGLLGFKSPTKDLNVTITLAVMSIVLVEAAGIRKKRALRDGFWALRSLCPS